MGRGSRQRGVDLRSERLGITGLGGRRCRGTCGPVRSCERLRGDAGVYTDWRKRPLGAVLGRLCTLLRREGHASERWGQECTQIGKNGPSGPFWGTCVHCCDARIVRAVARGRRSVHRSEKNGLSGPLWDMRVIPTSESIRSTFRKTPLDVG